MTRFQDRDKIQDIICTELVKIGTGKLMKTPLENGETLNVEACNFLWKRRLHASKRPPETLLPPKNSMAIFIKNLSFILQKIYLDLISMKNNELNWLTNEVGLVSFYLEASSYQRQVGNLEN